MKFSSCLILLGVFISVPKAAAAETVYGVPRVIDGDTLELDGERIRLHGIDAPETRQICVRDSAEWLCGQEASKSLRDYLRAKSQLTCDRVDIDRYGRIVAKCFTEGGTDIGEWMVSNGWALAYRRYSMDYVETEIIAESAKRGIWSGEFIKPWNWRRR